jgi:hypothetical protein
MKERRESVREKRTLMRTILKTCVSSLVLAATIANAQCCAGDIHGRITNQQGKPVAGATISVHDCEKDSNRLSTSDAEGKFRIDHIPMGPCVVTVNARGFKTYEKIGVQGVLDGNLEFNVVLKN